MCWRRLCVEENVVLCHLAPSWGSSNPPLPGSPGAEPSAATRASLVRRLHRRWGESVAPIFLLALLLVLTQTLPGATPRLHSARGAVLPSRRSPRSKNPALRTTQSPDVPRQTQGVQRLGDARRAGSRLFVWGSLESVGMSPRPSSACRSRTVRKGEGHQAAQECAPAASPIPSSGKSGPGSATPRAADRCATGHAGRPRETDHRPRPGCGRCVERSSARRCAAAGTVDLGARLRSRQSPCGLTRRWRQHGESCRLRKNLGKNRAARRRRSCFETDVVAHAVQFSAQKSTAGGTALSLLADSPTTGSGRIALLRQQPQPGRHNPGAVYSSGQGDAVRWRSRRRLATSVDRSHEPGCAPARRMVKLVQRQAQTRAIPAAYRS